MKGSHLWKRIYAGCVLAGLATGYGIFSTQNYQETENRKITKEDTLNRAAEDWDSVFFVENVRQTPEPALETGYPKKTENPEPTEALEQVEFLEPPKTVITQAAIEEEQCRTEVFVPEQNAEPKVEKTESMPSLASQWMQNGLVTQKTDMLSEVKEVELPKIQQEQVTEVFNVPAEIFGQIPTLNRTDEYVSYFEFSYDLVCLLEPVVREHGQNLNTLLAKFVVKALFCGVDVEKLDINAPIPRRLAALCLWLAAQVLNEEGCNTSAKSVQKYVTDISGCSRSEKKAVAYLYEQGIVAGCQIPGQSFYPEEGLKTESGSQWLSNAVKCWK